MIESSRFMGTHGYDEPEDLAARIGYTDPPTHISTFTGIGGFDLGLSYAGFETLVAIEADETAADVYELNFVDGDFLDQADPPAVLRRDIREIATWEVLEAAGVGIGQTTIVTGGPPCQGFSHIGKRDPDDPRNELYPEMVRIVHQAKPVFFCMENVPGLASMKDGRAIMEVCDVFAEGGYHVRWDILDAADYGVPQRRERVFIIGQRVDIAALPEEGNPQIHIGAKPGRVYHPEWFRERHDLEPPDQATLDAFADEPETLDEQLEQLIQEPPGAGAA